MSLETQDDAGLPLEIRVNNYLTANQPDLLHELLDVSPIFAAEICKRFHRTACDIFALIRAEERKRLPLQSLRDQWERQRKNLIAEAIKESNRHD
jgi:hypothetical protein